MHANLSRAIWAGAASAALLAAAPALADVKRGVDAWSQGDYALAVREWEGPAAAGDPAPGAADRAALLPGSVVPDEGLAIAGIFGDASKLAA